MTGETIMDQHTHVTHQWTPVRAAGARGTPVPISGWYRTREGALGEIETARRLLMLSSRKNLPSYGIRHAEVTTVTDAVEWLEEGA